MITFPELRSKRLSIDLKEISLLNASKILSMEPGRSEAENTLFLESIINKEKSNFTDPRAWTVQERMMAIAHYQMHTSDDKNFLIGENARFSDYFMEVDYVDDNIEIGEALGSTWNIIHLNGAMAEIIEQLEGTIEGIKGLIHWYVGMMGCQLRNETDNAPDPVADTSKFIDWLVERMTVFINYGESDYYTMLDLLFKGQSKLTHLFDISVDDKGIVAKPISQHEEGGAEGDELPSARFSAISCISIVTQEILGKHHK